MAKSPIHRISTSNVILNAQAGGKTTGSTATKSSGKSDGKKKQSPADKIAAEFGKRAPNFGLHNQATTIQSQQPSQAFLNNIRAPLQAQQAQQQGQAIAKGIEGLGKLFAQLDGAISGKGKGKAGCQSCQAGPTQDPGPTTPADGAPEADSEVDAEGGDEGSN
ncbi:MAG: hypothetical protein OXU45_01310 [Candidatus Melainabacteria bacterium]|nr:hypothetical protein [Candidatus Melainabacteria bacterium]